MTGLLAPRYAVDIAQMDTRAPPSSQRALLVSTRASRANVRLAPSLESP